MSPRALKNLYTGEIRPIFTWGSELWNQSTARAEIEPMKRVEYQALRKITGAYHGSSHNKLLGLAHIEPLETKLDDLSASWAARSLRTGDTHIRRTLDLPPPPTKHIARRQRRSTYPTENPPNSRSLLQDLNPSRRKVLRQLGRHRPNLPHRPHHSEGQDERS